MNTDFLQSPEAAAIVDAMANEFAYDEAIHGEKLKFVFMSFAENFEEYKQIKLRNEAIESMETKAQQLINQAQLLKSGEISIEEL